MNDTGSSWFSYCFCWSFSILSFFFKQEGHHGPSSLTLIKQCTAMQNTSRQLFWMQSPVLTRFSFIWPSDLYFFYLIWPDISTWTRYAVSRVWTIFSFIDLVSDPIWHIFKLNLDTIQTNILSRFSFNLT